MRLEHFLLIYFFIILIVVIVTFLAIRLLPEIDKSFNTEEFLLGNTDCCLEDALNELIIVNSMEDIYGIQQ